MPVGGEGDPLLVGARPALGDRDPILLEEEGGQVRGDEVVVGLADDLPLRRAEEALEGGIAGEVDALGVLEPDEVGDRLEEGREPALAFAEPLVGLEELEGHLDGGTGGRSRRSPCPRSRSA